MDATATGPWLTDAPINRRIHQRRSSARLLEADTLIARTPVPRTTAIAGQGQRRGHACTNRQPCSTPTSPL